MIPEEYQRNPVTVRILGGGRSPHSARMLYEVFYTDGTTKFVWGKALNVYPTSDNLNAKGKRLKDATRAYRPHLQPAMAAVSVLLQEIQSACLEIDGYEDRNEDMDV